MNCYPEYPLRTKLNLNGFWDFCFKEDEVCFSKLSCDHLDFDHIMMVPGAFDCTPDFYCKRGVAFYRKHFTTQMLWDHALIHCCWGIRGKIWIDGKLIGQSSLMYSGLTFNVEKLSPGDHEIIIAIDNRFIEKTSELFYPYYDFYAYGGIYRDITIEKVPDIYIDRVQVGIESIDEGRVKLSVLFKNMPDQQVKLEYRFNTQRFPSSKVVEVCQNKAVFTTIVPDFECWTLENPHLHQVEVNIDNDRIIEEFGIRTICASGKKILLNKKEIYLKGVNRHESHFDFGPATPETILVDDIQNLKRLNCNFVRGSHYSQDPRFLALCDRVGILVWEESLGWGNTAEQLKNTTFMALQEQQTRLMVQNSINHPAIILWGFLNEFNSETEEGRILCKRLIHGIKEEDNSRLVTFANCHMTCLKDICSDLVDVIAYNTYPGWISDDYRKDPDSVLVENRDKIIAFLKSKKWDNKPIMVSEMGCCAIYGAHDLDAAQWSEEFQKQYVNAVIDCVFSSEDLCGLTIWQMNDTKSYHRIGANIRCKPLSENMAGLFDRYRRPKLAAQLVQKRFLEK